MAQMNGFAENGLDEDAFGDKAGLSGLKTFDAFRRYFLFANVTHQTSSVSIELYARSSRKAYFSANLFFDR